MAIIGTHDKTTNIMLMFIVLVLSLHSVSALTFIALELKEINQVSVSLTQIEIEHGANLYKEVDNN